MCKLRPNTVRSRALACAAIVAVLAVPQTYAQAGDRAAGPPSLARTVSGEGAVATAARPPVNPREWPVIAAAEHSGRLSLGQPQAPSAARVGFQRHGRAYRQAQRMTAGVAMGILGALVGGVAGAGIGSLNSEESMLQGFGTGMCVGAVAGATVGVLLVK